MRGSGISPRGSGAGGQGGAQPPHGGEHGAGRGGGGQSGLRLTDEAQASPHFTFTSIASPPIFMILLSSIRILPRSKKPKKPPPRLEGTIIAVSFPFGKEISRSTICPKLVPSAIFITSRFLRSLKERSIYTIICEALPILSFLHFKKLPRAIYLCAGLRSYYIMFYGRS